MRNDLRVSKRRFFGGTTRLSGLIPVAFSLILFWPFSGGGQKVEMTAGRAVPAAQGTVHFHNGHNGNTQVDMKVQDLALPSELTPPKNVYVVWFQEQGQAPQNQGALKVGKDLDGQFKTVTPYRRFEVFLTAEQSAQVNTPSGQQLLKANVVPH